MLEAFFTKQLSDILHLLLKELGTLRARRQQEIEELERTFGPLDQLVPYYITPDGQNVNPADLEDDDTGLVARTSVFEMLAVFFSGPVRYSHAFVLSDAGMGKSSLMVMLRLFYLNKFIQPDFEVKLLKIGPETLDQVKALPHPQSTVLLLDALDEDPDAWKNFYTRLQMLLQGTKHFRKVVITCRTQFFPQEYEEDGRVPGQIILSGFYCSKLFLSPFNLPQVYRYLKKRFPDEFTRKQAIEMVGRMQSLKFRPMLLSYIDFLLDGQRHIEYSYALYESLVDEWLNRELRKGVLLEKKTLYRVCTQIANYMYVTKARDVDPIQLQSLYLPLDGVRQLETMSVEGRSLLHRTSAGNYKFAHLSIMEYFVATSLSTQPRPWKNSDQVISFLADVLRHRKLRHCKGVDLHSLSVPGVALHGADFSSCQLTDANFSGTELDSASFTAADLTGSNFASANAVNANFARAKMKQCILAGARLAGASLLGVDLSGCDLSKADLTQSELEVASFKGANLEGARLRRVKAQSLHFDGANLQDCDASKTVLPNAFFNGAIMPSACLDEAAMESASFKKSKLQQVKMARFVGPKCDFSDAILDSVNASNANLTCANATGVHAQAAVFDGARFANTDFTRADLDHASFQSCDLEGVKFKDSSLRSARCQKANLRNAKMTAVEATGADFSGASMVSVALISTKMAAANLQDVDLTGAKIDGADMSNANLSRSIIANTSIESSSLAGATFHRNKVCITSFRSCNLQRAVFQNCDLLEVDFSKADLRGTSFSDSSLSDCVWAAARYDSKTQWPNAFDPRRIGALGPGTDVRSKSFSQTDFDNIDLQGAKLTGCDFRESSFIAANLQGADLSFAECFKSNFSGANLAGANLMKSDLRKANFSKADLSNTDLREARYDEETLLPPEIKADLKRHGLVFVPSKRP